MSVIKKIALLTTMVILGIQLIRPGYNKSSEVQLTDFAKVYRVPDNVQTILQNACYDCHSNSTNYPWYANIQPVGWIQASHIKDGKEQLNFSVFGSYPIRRQISKLKGIANQIKDDAMPISSYKMMHHNANLSKDDKALIVDWMNKTADSFSANN